MSIDIMVDPGYKANQSFKEFDFYIILFEILILTFVHSLIFYKYIEI